MCIENSAWCHSFKKRASNAQYGNLDDSIVGAGVAGDFARARHDAHFGAWHRPRAMHCAAQRVGHDFGGGRGASVFAGIGLGNGVTPLPICLAALVMGRRGVFAVFGRENAVCKQSRQYGDCLCCAHQRRASGERRHNQQLDQSQIAAVYVCVYPTICRSASWACVVAIADIGQLAKAHGHRVFGQHCFGFGQGRRVFERAPTLAVVATTLYGCGDDGLGRAFVFQWQQQVKQYE